MCALHSVGAVIPIQLFYSMALAERSLFIKASLRDGVREMRGWLSAQSSRKAVISFVVLQKKPFSLFRPVTDLDQAPDAGRLELGSIAPSS